MKKITPIVFLLTFLSTNTFSTTLDYRHEYFDDYNSHRDRIQVAHRFGNNLGFVLETKYRSGGSKNGEAYSDLVSNGTEAEINYFYKVNNTYSLLPGLLQWSSSDYSSWRPFIRLNYKVNDDLTLSARYRYEYTRYDDKSIKNDDITHRGDAWIAYSLSDTWRAEYNYVYKQSEDNNLYNNKKNDYEHNIKIDYKWSASWTPYIEAGNVSVRNSASDRQTRLRLGVKYTF